MKISEFAITSPEMEILFLGSGSAYSEELGDSSAVLLVESKPLLCIDFGFTSFNKYKKEFDSVPSSVFITHAHLDHIGGLENLAYHNILHPKKPVTKLFVPASLVYCLHHRLGSLPNFLSDGGAQFWDAFQLIPVSDHFILDSLRFSVFESRHHAPFASYGISLKGRFLFTGDTRPIPEQIVAHASQGEVIFHDCSLRGNSSHSGISCIEQEYKPSELKRMVLYHLGSAEDAAELSKQHRVAFPSSRHKI
ncbi:MAG: MBL fold metallo-hydrolase [Gammaproteobacteria bacterium]|nr:MBL fold metallo-hydrolase [Gammaproteobacteria bacterium]